jgi:2-polyprenyl-6-methoxyphenol hydroxylase-like FAD-dependent oxidoreductase
VRVLIAGAGAAGLFTALQLARAGHEVTVLDRDAVEPAPDVETAAAAAFRPTAPQIVQPHALLPRCRELLRERLPDVYAALLDAGAVEAPLPTQMPPTLTDRSARPGDERLTMVLTRRSTFDWVLQRAAACQPRLALHGRTRVTGLVATPGRPPRVRGVTTDRGALTADLVVDATGRRTALDRWLGGVGAASAITERTECGLAYYSRHYRLRRTTGLPGPRTTRTVAALDEFVVGIWAGDNATMVLVVAPLVEDTRFRALTDPDVLTAVLRTMPTYAAWLDVLEPISDIYPMGGLHNTLRRLVVDGRPVVTGIATVGDSVCTTNPTFGRGLALALQGAADLADRLSGPIGPTVLPQALDAAVTANVAPYYRDQATNDAARLAVMRHTLFGAPAPRPLGDPGQVGFAQLRQAALFDPTVFRAFWAVMGMTALRPDKVYTDPAVVAHTRAVLARHEPPPLPQPTTHQLETALGCTVRPRSLREVPDRAHNGPASLRGTVGRA